MSTAFLKLMHLADSALPIGATSHSFGCETLAAEGSVRAIDLEPLLTALLWDNGQAEAVICRLAYRLAANGLPTANGDSAVRGAYPIGPPLFAHWLALNQLVAAMKSARESRVASATLGRRFLQLVANLEDAQPLQTLYQRTPATNVHYCVAFGFVGGYLGLGEEETVLAYLQQNTMGFLSAALRLFAIGQGRAGEILWRLKTVIAAVAEASAVATAAAPHGPLSSEWTTCLDTLSIFTPMLDLGSMRHPLLRTRLFIS